MKVLKCIVVCCLLTGFWGCKNSSLNVPPYTVSKIFKSDTLTTVNVHINNRLTAPELVLLAGKLKADSAKIQNLEIHYLLPGNAETSAGDHSFYASARYLKDTEVKPADTLKDENGNFLHLKILGLNKKQANKLLSLQPNEIKGKNVLGRFIDDYNHTVIIPFNDPADKKKDLYIVELDSTAKVVSATVPQKVVEDGIDKWLVTQNGDYLIIRNKVLGQYAADGMGVPFNSIKSGI